MLRWLRTLAVYLLLLVCGRGGYERFVRAVTGNCKKRRNRKYVPGIREELDELVDTPDDCYCDTQFVGVTRDGQVVSFGLTRVQNRQEHARVSVELPGMGSFSYQHSRSLTFGSGKLRLEMLEPMRRWKISFSGTVNLNTGNGDSELLHASLSLYWQCLADPFNYRTCLSKWQFAKNVCHLNSDFWKMLTNPYQIQYEQWGEMRGKVEIEGITSQFIILRAFRKRRIQRIGNCPVSQHVSQHLIQYDSGHLVSYGSVHGKNGVLKEKHGYITFPVGERWATDQSDMEVVRMNDSSLRVKYPLPIYAIGKTFLIDETLDQAVTEGSQTAATDTLLHFSRYTLNGKEAYGISCLETLPSFNLGDNVELFSDSEPVPERHSDFTVRLQVDTHLPTSMVGGKGANLAILNRLNYNVPEGFCVTSEAFTTQVKSHDDLQSAIEMIKTESGKQSRPRLPIVCSNAVTTCVDSQLCPSVATAIQEELLQMFGAEFGEQYFAVRSSGVREDGTEMSCAGQLETFLEVRGLDNILQAVEKCWASSFAYQAVEYRRQNGQPVTEAIAVVVQEMVQADTAGVLFTSDPVTGNSAVLVINAAPGLGEQVVSGNCDPDTVKVRRTKDSDNFQMVLRVAGAHSPKQATVTRDESAGHGESEDITELCITDDQINQLCRMGVELEETLGSPQDIEWAIAGGELYLLQTRPITSLHEDTDEELLHEFDTPVAFDSECITSANTGEVCPGAASTLMTDMYVRLSSDSIEKIMENASGSRFSAYAARAGRIHTNKTFLGWTALSVAAVDGFLQDKSLLDVFIFGQVLNEHSEDIVREFKGRKTSKVSAITSFLNNNFIQMPKYVKWFLEWEKQLDSFTVGETSDTAVELYQDIDEKRHILFDVWLANIYKTNESMVPFAILFSLLRGKAAQVSEKSFADIAVLLATCSNVCSAEVPKALQKLAETITDSSVKDTFLELPDESGHECLMTAEPVVRNCYKEFLEAHGHRCIKEGEFMEKSWRSEPSKLMRALKLLIKSPTLDRPVDKETLDKDPVDMLQTPLSWLQKMFVRKYLLAKAKAGVAAREHGKSVTIKTGDAFKVAYWKLAELLLKEGYLPEERVMFFLTHREIGTLIEARSAALVRKARRRMSIFRQQEAIQYPKVNFGRPIPLPAESGDTHQHSLVATGLPVGKGVATGRACVIENVDDADSIQSGDILICPYTDVGWSPYFPMLSGLVTEIGGLISHGAVVAREMGLPCIVNVADATHIFKTGETVRIDGLAGIVQKLTD